MKLTLLLPILVAAGKTIANLEAEADLESRLHPKADSESPLQPEADPLSDLHPELNPQTNIQQTLAPLSTTDAIIRVHITTYILTNAQAVEAAASHSIHTVIGTRTRPTLIITPLHPSPSTPSTTHTTTIRIPSSSSSSSPSPSTPSTSLPPSPTIPDPNNSINKCYLIHPCMSLLTHLQHCYDTYHGISNPNSLPESQSYWRCICDISFSPPVLKNFATAFQPCMSCFLASHLPFQYTDDLERSFRGFCTAGRPNVWMLFRDVVMFVREAHAPGPVIWGALSHGFRNITTLSKLFTSKTEWNNPSFFPPGWSSTGFPRPSKTGSIEGGGEATFSLDPMLLEQVPRGWPYTKWGVRRREGETATWTLTGSEGEAVAEVRESVGWWPRRVGGRRGGG